MKRKFQFMYILKQSVSNRWRVLFIYLFFMDYPLKYSCVTQKKKTKTETKSKQKKPKTLNVIKMRAP